jgi:hypothetical protein
MHKQFLPLLAACALLLFAGCEKETVQPAAAKVMSPEDFLKTQVKQPVLFQSEYRNPATSECFGWLVDDQGQVRAYNLSGEPEACLPAAATCTPEDLVRLLSRATTVQTTLPASEVVAHFKLIAGAANGQLSPLTENSSEQGTLTLRAFQKTQVEYDYSNGCSSNPGSNAMFETYRQEQSMTLIDAYSMVTLRLSGAQSQENLSESARNIVRWMESTGKDAGL